LPEILAQFLLSDVSVTPLGFQRGNRGDRIAVGESEQYGLVEYHLQYIAHHVCHARGFPIGIDELRDMLCLDLVRAELGKAHLDSVRADLVILVCRFSDSTFAFRHYPINDIVEAARGNTSW